MDPSLTEPVVGYTDGAAHLADLLSRVALCVERLHWVEGEGGVKAEQFADGVRALDRLIEGRLAATADRAALPVERLRARFGLSPRAVDLLVAAAAPGLSLELFRAALPREPERRQPDVAWLVELLAFAPADRAALLDELGPGAPLVRWRLVRLGAPRGWTPEGPLVAQPVAVSPRIAAFLGGRTAFDAAAFDPAVRLRTDSDPVAAPLLATMGRALFRTHHGRHLPAVVVGSALSGKATAATAAARAAGHPTLEVDLEGLVMAADPVSLLLDVEREARLQGALLVLRRGELLGEARADVRRAVLNLLGTGAVPVAVTTRDPLPELVRRVPGTQSVRLELPTGEEQLRLWRTALPDDVPRAAEANLDAIVGRYHLTPGDILEAGSQAIAHAHLRGPGAEVTLADLVAAVRGRLRHRLADIAELVVTPLGWGDLVLRDDVHERIREFLSTVKHRSTVMQDWGFADKVAYGRAVSALFSGPPGTGKTMVATLIAKELGLELFRVDLSRVVSKWVGETEKNLGRAFDEAGNSQAVLLFDEADALFAKRTEVKSSNDRYANLEVNYLLQRLESFEGIVILTTNHQSAVDDAFRRRLRFRIDFPTPDEAERERLWRAMMPAGAPVAGDVDFKALGRRFSMAGGYIKNAVVRAAFLAAAQAGGSIDHKTLMRAAALEWEDMGNLTMSVG